MLAARGPKYTLINPCNCVNLAYRWDQSGLPSHLNRHEVHDRLSKRDAVGFVDKEGGLEGGFVCHVRATDIILVW